MLFIFSAKSKERSFRANQLPNHTVPGHASQRQFTSTNSGQSSPVADDFHLIC